VGTLLGAETVPVRRLAILWAGIGGWVMGSAFYLCFVRHEVGLLLLGLPPALLSAAAVARATRDRESVPQAIVGLSVLASLLCPLATLSPLIVVAAIDGDPFVGVGVVIGGGVVGAFFGAPLGIGFGVIFSWVWRAIDGARSYGYASLGVARMRFGLAFIGLAFLLGAVDVVFPTLWPIVHEPPFASPRTNVLAWLALGTFTFGVAVSASALAWHLRRVRWARRVRAGAVPGWALVPLESVPDAESLPRLFTTGASDRVLVRRTAGAAGPFRSSESVEPVART